MVALDRVLAIDIGGSKVVAGLVAASGAVSGRAELRGRATGPEGVLDAARTLIDRVLRDGGAGERIRCVGVAAAGVVDPTTGRILSAVETIPRWTGVEVARIVEDHTGLPTFVENDVNAAAVAETRLGAAKGAASALVVTVGTGIGGAIVIGGQLYRGASMSAGELGHLPVDVFGDEWSGGRCNCGKLGHLESVASGPAIASRYARHSDDAEPVALEDMAEAMRAGDPLAVAVVDEAAAVLGRVLGGLVNVIDPEVVVLGGGVLALGERYVGRLEEALREEALPGPRTVRVVRASLGNDAGMVGAALLAAERMDTSVRGSAEVLGSPR